MTPRELFQQIMNYGTFDRMPVFHWAGWEETYGRWHSEGLPADIGLGGDRSAEQAYFGTNRHWAGVGVHLNLFPAFEEEVLEETDEYRIFRDTSGVVQKDWKGRSCIPNFVDYTLKEAKDWPAFKERLQPDPARVPEQLDQHIADAEGSGLALVIGTASMMGWIRNWMGVENMSYLMYDAPDVYADMVDTLAELTCWGIDQIMPRMHETPDLGFGWEDICGRNGPLVGPPIFRQCVAPGYRKIRDKLDSHGIGLLGIDTDGFVEPLVGDWLEAGVNLQFPVEIGAWNADPHALRRKFGTELRIMGGYNKLVLEQGRDAIDAEIQRRLPLMKEGGFVLMPDHLITPGVPLEDYKYYLQQVRELRF